MRIGVIGNRTLDPGDQLRQTAAVADVAREIRDICNDLPSDVRSLYAPGAALIRVVTSVAEGADRIGARVALEMGFGLDCVLPFERTAFAHDFESEESRDEYEGLLAKARAVFELDGSRRDDAVRALAYQAASERVLAQSDVLIAIWTGAEAKGPGGTATTVRSALRSGTPVLWINASQPDERYLQDTEGTWTQFTSEALRGHVLQILSSPGPADGVARDDYFSERMPRFAPLNGTWRAFRAVVLPGHGTRRRAVLRRIGDEANREWLAGWETKPSLPGTVVGELNASLQPQFRWADGLSNYYGNQYRSTFVLIYLLGAVAVLLAVLGQTLGIDGAGGGGEAFKAIVSLGTIGAILGLRHLGEHRRWHDRWIDYRLLAEFFRQMGFLAPLCISPPRAQQPLHRSSQDPGNSWMGWHARAVAREMGVISAALNAEYLQSARAMLRDGWVSHQLDYHRHNAAANRQMQHRLQLAGTVTLAGTVGGILLLLITGASAWSVMAAVLPAVGAGIAGIRSQSEMERIARRSGAIATGLSEFRDALDRVVIEDAAGTSQRLSSLAQSLATAMTDDVLDWRIVFDSRQAEVHG